MATNERLYQAIQNYALTRGLTYPKAVKELAGNAGIDHRYLYKIVRGARKGSSTTQFALARSLCGLVDQLFAPPPQRLIKPVKGGAGDAYLYEAKERGDP